MKYEDRNFMVFSTSEINKINFDEVLETDAQWLRKSVNETKTFVKWDGDNIPNSVQTLTTSEGPYNYDEMIILLNSSEWIDYTSIIT
jgi:hypothetical protein